MSNKIFLITSGAYVASELASDFGSVPSAFLPIGHKRLFELQVDTIKDFDGEKYISIPNDYHIHDRDAVILQKNSIKTFKSSPVISLRESILEFLIQKGFESTNELYILHGDTLFSKLDFFPDLLYYNHTNMFYKWGIVQNIIEKNVQIFGNSIVSGYFSFSNISLLKYALENNKDFISSLSEYHKVNPFNLKSGADWLDFGHSNLYYKSKVKLNVTRYFNKTAFKKNYILKSSLDHEKVINEFKWFKNIPNEISFYVPRVWDLDYQEASYKIEFIGAPTLQEKFVFGNLPDRFFLDVVDDLFALVEKFRIHGFECSVQRKKSILKTLYIHKSVERISKFLVETDFNPDKKIVINGRKYPTLNEFKNKIFSELNVRLDNIEVPGMDLMHGDLCFSNILLDNRSNSLKLIDPRGNISNADLGGNGNMGDFAYDIAKLGHSLIGNYDSIVTGFFSLDCDLINYNFEFELAKEASDELKIHYYNHARRLGLKNSFLNAAIANLFLSMLPLHRESPHRQQAFLINAFQFYYQ